MEKALKLPVDSAPFWHCIVMGTFTQPIVIKNPIPVITYWYFLLFAGIYVAL